jgi:hypothetical protein
MGHSRRTEHRAGVDGWPLCLSLGGLICIDDLKQLHSRSHQTAKHDEDAYDRAGLGLNSIMYINPNAKAEAAALDMERADKGPRGPLARHSILLKDNLDVINMATTNGSAVTRDPIPPEDGSISKALRAAGAVILAKTAMGEFAGGSYNSVRGQTLNGAPKLSLPNADAPCACYARRCPISPPTRHLSARAQPRPPTGQPITLGNMREQNTWIRSQRIGDWQHVAVGSEHEV